MNKVRAAVARTPTMPVINGEASYEMLLDTLPTRWTRAMFWLCVTNGAAGHTYGANGIWQCNRKDQPHGASPHGGNYGKIAWDDAMRLPGSYQVALGKRLFEQYPWHRFTPHPEWVAYGERPELSLDGCSWIWFPEGRPAKDAPAEKRFFRRVFSLPEGRPIAQARLRVSADDAFSVRLNGQVVGSGSDWRAGSQFDHVVPRLRPGVNVLAVAAENGRANVPANPAGLICRLEVRFADGGTASIVSDDAWRCSKAGPAGWETAALDDAAWPKAQVVGRHGDGPWGRVRLVDDDTAGPQATGIADQLRIVYAPESRPVVARHLGPQTVYAASHFNPVTGMRAAIGDIRADAAGTWTCAPPPGVEDDWVLILEARR